MNYLLKLSAVVFCLTTLSFSQSTGDPCDSHDECDGSNSVGPNWCYSNGDGDAYCVEASWDFCVNNLCYEGDGDCDCGGDCSVPGADQIECVGNLECVQYADDGGIGTDIDICACTVGYDECGVCGGDNNTCTAPSSQMAAYYFSSITLDGQPLTSTDEIKAFNESSGLTSFSSSS